MDNKASKNEFLGYIHSMWKQGEISESALIKIRDMYCKEKISSKEDVQDRKLQNNDQNEHRNQYFNSAGVQNDLEEEANKEQYTNVQPKIINTIYNNEVKGIINRRYDNKNIKPINEQIKLTKERNITIILSLGIILILLAGIILATSTWDLMSNGLKTIALFMVSILFFAMSSFAEKKLEIRKTSFAFWILGNLFLPVILLSIGFFKLLGTYLSIGGEGGYIYGIISCGICLIFFGYSIKKYKNSAFTWITLIDSEILYWFILKQIDFSYNMEILMLIIYTLLLTGIYHKLHEKQKAYDFAIKAIRWYVFINIIFYAMQILGITIYTTFMSMIGEPKGAFQGIIIIIGIIILASIITYWCYKFKFRGGVFVAGTLILAIQMLCTIFRINSNEFPYYIVMHVGLLTIYGVIYYYNNLKYLKYIKSGTDVIILATMGVLDLISMITLGSMYTAILLYVLVAMMIITCRKSKHALYLLLLKSTIPITLFIGNLFILTEFKLIINLFSIKQFHIGFIYILFNIGIIYGISAILRLKKNNDYKIYLNEGHVFLGLIYFCTLFFQIDRLLCGIAISIVAAICLVASKKDFKIRIYLYSLITMVTIILFDLELFLHLSKSNILILRPQNLFLCISLILSIIWRFSKEIWKKKFDIYMIGMYSLGFLCSLIFNNFEELDYILLCFLIVCVGVMGMFLYKNKRNELICIPIAYFWLISLRIIYYFDDINQIIANCFVACILIAVSYSLYKIYKKISVKELIVYNALAGLSIMFSIMISFGDTIPYVFNIFALMAFAGFLYYISLHQVNDYLKNSLFICCIIFNYIAYGRLILELDFLGNFREEFLLVPSVIVLYLIANCYFEKKNDLCAIISIIWYIIVGSILLLFNQGNSEFHAITFCGLCIISIIMGFRLQSKLYFAGGTIFLIIGVFLNTLNFWVNIPWWIYLLIGGTLLIVFASRSEFVKGKKQDKKENFVSKLLIRLKKW